MLGHASRVLLYSNILELCVKMMCSRKRNTEDALVGSTRFRPAGGLSQTMAWALKLSKITSAQLAQHPMIQQLFLNFPLSASRRQSTTT